MPQYWVVALYGWFSCMLLINENKHDTEKQPQKYKFIKYKLKIVI